MRAEVVALAVLLALSAGAVGAQEEPEPTEEPSSSPSPLVAAGWCIWADDHAKDAEEETDEPGCDAGVGLALARWKRLAWVAVVGSQTLGTGAAWIPHQPRSGPTLAVALGLVVRYDERGIHKKIYPALGATLSFGRRIAEDNE